MAAALKFELGSKEFEAIPVKLERKKLYGYTDVVATDDEGNVCQALQTQTPYPVALGETLIAADPEVDMEQFGRVSVTNSASTRQGVAS